MKKILSILFLLLTIQGVMAQSDYISYRPYEQADRLENLGGKRGVLILSQRSDLVITVTNAPEVQAPAAQRRGDGLFEYELVLDAESPRQPKIEVNRRGDVDRVDWVVTPKVDYFSAYLIEETAKPIRLEEQTAANSAILDGTLCEVEFQSTIPDLVVDCQRLVEKGAKVKRESKQGDNSIQIIRVIIPVAILENAKKQMEDSQKTWQSLYDLLMNRDDAPAGEYERLDMLKEQTTKAEEEYRSLTQLNVYATGTNQLPVDISGLKPRSKMVYGVLLRTIIEEKHVSQCAGFMAEGGRQFALREYTNARQSFLNALKAPDTPANLRNSIQTTMAQCDTCNAYEKWTLRAFARIRDIKAKGGSQEEAVECANSAIAYLQILNRYNPCEFYSSRIKQLEKAVQSLPLEIRFTTARWVKNVSGFYEAGRISGVEIYSFRGASVPSAKEYKTDKKFRELMEENTANFVREGVTDANGQADLHLSRQSLPTGFFLRPVGSNDKIKIYYIGFDALMRQSQGTYNKRQFRVKMYAEY